MGDFRDSPFGAGPLGFVETGTANFGDIETPGDSDVFQTQLIQGLSYTIEMRGADTGDGSLADPFLDVLNFAGNFLASDDDSGAGLNALEVFTAGYTGTHYLSLRSFSVNATGDYVVSVSQGFGDNGNNTVNGTNFADAIGGLGGNDTIRGNGGNDWLDGGDGNDTLLGGDGNDFMTGAKGKDLLRGGAGNDVLRAGADADIYVGGTGNDEFVFLAAAQSKPGATRDQIRGGDGAIAFEGAGLAIGDVFNLTEIDADTTIAGNQAFKFGGTSQFGKGFVWLANSGSDTILRGNIDNDAAPEFEVEIEDGGAISASTYRSQDFFL